MEIETAGQGTFKANYITPTSNVVGTRTASTVLPQWTFPVLKFLPFQDRAAVTQWSKAHAELDRDNFYWKFLSTRLVFEAKLYIPGDLCKETDIIDAEEEEEEPLEMSGQDAIGKTAATLGWQEVFHDLWQRRDMWTDTIGEGDAEDIDDKLRGKEYRFNIGVCARFRPKVKTAGGRDDDGEQDGVGEDVVLPLHQRLQLVMASRGPGCTREMAMQVLCEEHKQREGKKLARERRRLGLSSKQGGTDSGAGTAGGAGGAGGAGAAGAAAAGSSTSTSSYDPWSQQDCMVSATFTTKGSGKQADAGREGGQVVAGAASSEGGDGVDSSDDEGGDGGGGRGEAGGSMKASILAVKPSEGEKPSEGNKPSKINKTSEGKKVSEGEKSSEGVRQASEGNKKSTGEKASAGEKPSEGDKVSEGLGRATVRR
jgi:hypothetical protein